MEHVAKEQLRRGFSNIQDYFFPKNCFNCSQEGAWLCESCRDSFFFIDGTFCPFCGKLSNGFEVCASCKSKTNISKVFSVFKYSDPLIQKLIKNFKYRYLEDIIFDLDPIIRRFLFKYRNLINKESSVLIPVPLTKYKKCERGFNQAEIIADKIGEILNMPIKNDLIIKRKPTKNQADISHSNRFNNLKNAFKLKANAPESVIIVDDVFTTGSTVREIADILHSAGTKKIEIITLARG